MLGVSQALLMKCGCLKLPGPLPGRHPTSLSCFCMTLPWPILYLFHSVGPRKQSYCPCLQVIGVCPHIPSLPRFHGHLEGQGIIPVLWLTLRVSFCKTHPVPHSMAPTTSWYMGCSVGWGQSENSNNFTSEVEWRAAGPAFEFQSLCSFHYAILCCLNEIFRIASWHIGWMKTIHLAHNCYVD